MKTSISGAQLCRYLCLLAPGVMTSAHAQNLFLSGELVEPPSCTINEGQVIDVAFGQNIAIRKLDGVNYRQTINYKIHCDVSQLEWSLSLKISGDATTFNPAALQTSVAGLGIEMLQDGKPLALNKALAIDPNHPPALQAVPVKDPAVELAATAFEVTATLTAEYQ
ncbi:fimbrial protein [Pseudomonas sp. HLT2-19-2]